MTQHHPDPDARLDDLVGLITAGETLEAAGQKYGITRERVRQLLRTVGIEASKVRQARYDRIAAIPLTCRFCGKEYLAADKTSHFARGNHRFMVRQRSPEQIVQDRAIIVDYEAGMLTRDILAKHKVAATRITRAFEWEGKPMPNRVRSNMLPTRAESQVRMMAMARDYAAGQTSRVIARKYDVSPGMVTIACKFAGVPMRPKVLTPEWQRAMAEGRHRAALRRRAEREGRG